MSQHDTDTVRPLVNAASTIQKRLFKHAENFKLHLLVFLIGL